MDKPRNWSGALAALLVVAAVGLVVLLGRGPGTSMASGASVPNDFTVSEPNPIVSASDRGLLPTTADSVAVRTRRPVDDEPSSAHPDVSVFRGTVLDRDTDAPIAGATVRISLYEGRGSWPLGRALTGPDGCFEIAYRIPGDLRGQPRDELGHMTQVHAPGYKAGVVWASGWLTKDDPDRFSIELSPGHHVTVLVVDEAGRPVRDSEVHAFFARASDDSWTWEEECSTDGYGMAVISIPRASFMHLSAEKAEVGYGCSIRLSTEQVLDQRIPDLVLQPHGILAGRVLYPDGRPAAHLTLMVERVGYDASFLPWTDGYREVHLTSDGEGRFLARGLADGSYTVRDPSGATEPHTVETGSTSIELVTFVRRLEVDPRDETGEWTTRGFGVAQRIGHDWSYLPLSNISWDCDSAGTVMVVVPGPGSYAVCRWSSDAPPQHVVVSVRPEDHEVQVRFPASPFIPARGLQARLFDPAGEPLRFHAVLATPIGMRFRPIEFSPDGSMVNEDPLPSGRWLLTLVPSVAEPLYMPVSGEIILEAARQCSVEWTARERAGRVVVALYAREEVGGSLVVELSRSRGGEVEHTWETRVEFGPVTGRTVFTNELLPVGIWWARATLEGFSVEEKLFVVEKSGASRLELHAHRDRH